jgi:integrase
VAHSSIVAKPAKPYHDFPLFPHATKRWAKKIRGKLHYFGPWDNPNGALQKYLEQRDDLHAGRTPRVETDGFTIRDLCNRFLTAKKNQRDAGDITSRTFADYLSTCKLITDSFGKQRLVVDLATDDFEQLRARLAKNRNPNSMGNEVQRIRTVFKYGHDAGLIEHPVRFGPTFKRPAKRILRALRHTFETIAGESRDQVAVNHIMGHADSTMAAVYRERISDERLQDVSEFVRSWLFPPEEESAK